MSKFYIRNTKTKKEYVSVTFKEGAASNIVRDMSIVIGVIIVSVVILFLFF